MLLDKQANAAEGIPVVGLAEAVELVEALAGEDSWYEDISDETVYVCVFCEELATYPEPLPNEGHKQRCIAARAKEWVKAYRKST